MQRVWTKVFLSGILPSTYYQLPKKTNTTKHDASQRSSTDMHPVPFGKLSSTSGRGSPSEGSRGALVPCPPGLLCKLWGSMFISRSTWELLLLMVDPLLVGIQGTSKGTSNSTGVTGHRLVACELKRSPPLEAKTSWKRRKPAP